MTLRAREIDVYGRRWRQVMERTIIPIATEIDETESLPNELLKTLSAEGVWASFVPREQGGVGLDAIRYGILHGEIGRASTAVRNLLTAHDMVAHCIMYWGEDLHRERWIRALTTGETRASFALTEEQAGSDIRAVATYAVEDSSGGYVLNGSKMWVTGGQIADLFLIGARLEDELVPFLLESDAAGLSVYPVEGMLGGRGSMLARLKLEDCRVGAEARITQRGRGRASLNSSLQRGRSSVAWGCTGLGEACLTTSVARARSRQTFGKELLGHQLVRRMVSNMATENAAGRALCLRAAEMTDGQHPRAVVATLMAKQFAAAAACRAAADTVQICGATGCQMAHQAARLYRDAKVMEIIEGSREVLESLIADFV